MLDKEEIIYLLELQLHPTSNKCVLNILVLPSYDNALLLEYKKPTNATWNFPKIDQTIQFSFTQSFGQLIGFVDSTYYHNNLLLISNKKVNFTSAFTPHITMISSLILTCNLISSKYYNPINVFSTIPITSKFGTFQNCTFPNTQTIITEGNYNSIVIEILDQNFNRITLNDTNIVITLLITENVNENG